MRPLSTAACTAALVALVAAASAADDSREAIARCNDADNDAARIACLEDALRALSNAAADDAPAAVAPDAVDMAGMAREAAPRATPTPAAKSGPAGVPDDFGGEQVARRQQRDDDYSRIAAEVVGFSFVGRNKLRVELANGQVWQQNPSDRPNLYPSLRNEERFPVQLWRTRLGTYRMHIPAAGRTIRVERLE